MRTLYLIFSHDHQSQLRRLAGAIRHLSPGAAVAIHHDPGIAALDAGCFSTLSDIHIVPNPIRGEWGDFSLVAQYLHSLTWCKQHLEFDWVVTLTGLCYPTMSLGAFEKVLENSPFDAHVYFFDAFDPTHWPAGTAETRYLYAYFKLPRNRYYYKVPRALRRLLGQTRMAVNKHLPLLRVVPMPRGAQMRLGIRRMRMPFGKEFIICGGRQMFNVNRLTLDRMLGYINNNSGYLEYAKRTLIPDEAFFTSLIANDRALRVNNDVLRYIKWPRDKLHASSVDVIRREEVTAILASNHPFALKFDSRVDAEALDLVDRHLGLPGSTG